MTKLYCFSKKVTLEDPTQCIICEHKGKLIFAEKGYISCDNIRTAEDGKVNTIMPLDNKYSEVKQVSNDQSSVNIRLNQLEFTAPPIKVFLTPL